MRIDLIELSMRGRDLSAREVAELEAVVARNPSDAEARAVLACFYSTASKGIEDPRRIAHALWFIEHRPADPFTSVPFVAVPHILGESFAKARRLWLKHTRGTTSLSILRGAARFFASAEMPRSLALLKKARALKPSDRELLAQIGRTHLSLARSAAGSKRRQHGARSLEALTAHRERDPRKRWYRQGPIAHAALCAGKHDLARATAEAMLSGAGEYDDWNTGNAVHEAHSVLGLLAIEAGDADTAANHLLEAGATRGSPQLNSFGPDLELARAVLKRGRGKAVVEYLRRVMTFWSMAGGDPERWIREIRKTGTTTFDRKFRAGRDVKPRQRRASV